METIRSYLQLTRAHTAPLETVPALLGALLATGGQISVSVLLWGLFGLLYHLAGYGMNSIVDWMKGYDRLDRNKQHHPLNRGSIQLHRAGLFVAGLFIALLVLSVGLAYSEIPALIFLLLGAIAGVSYNYIGKETSYKFLLISFSHTTVFIIPYLAMGGDIFAMEFRLTASYVFLWVVFQISVSGEIKDILELDESNFLRDKLGVKVRKTQYPTPGDLDRDILVFSTDAKLYSMGVKLFNVSIGWFIFMLLADLPMMRFTEKTILWIAVWGVMMVPIEAFTILLVNDGRYYRNWRIGLMARIELLTMFIFIASLYPIVGLEAVVTLMVGSVVWLAVFNQVEWGRWLTPDV